MYTLSYFVIKKLFRFLNKVLRLLLKTLNLKNALPFLIPLLYGGWDPPRVTSGLDCSCSSGLDPTQGFFLCRPVAGLWGQERSRRFLGRDGWRNGPIGYRPMMFRRGTRPTRVFTEMSPLLGESPEIATVYHWVSDTPVLAWGPVWQTLALPPSEMLLRNPALCSVACGCHLWYSLPWVMTDAMLLWQRKQYG